MNFSLNLAKNYQLFLSNMYRDSNGISYSDPWVYQDTKESTVKGASYNNSEYFKELELYKHFMLVSKDKSYKAFEEYKKNYENN